MEPILSSLNGFNFWVVRMGPLSSSLVSQVEGTCQPGNPANSSGMLYLIKSQVMNALEKAPHHTSVSLYVFFADC